MKAGELNRKVTIQYCSVTYNSYNEPEETWLDLSEKWAAVITSGGREFYAAQKLNAETTAVFKIRYTNTINSKMRIKYGNRLFDILFINDVDGKHEEMQISAKEIV